MFDSLVWFVEYPAVFIVYFKLSVIELRYAIRERGWEMSESR
jgi:hypothetical protein